MYILLLQLRFHCSRFRRIRTLNQYILEANPPIAGPGVAFSGKNAGILHNPFANFHTNTFAYHNSFFYFDNSLFLPLISEQ